MIARRLFLAGGASALSGCAFLQSMLPEREGGAPDVVAMNGFVAVGDRIVVNGEITPQAVAMFSDLLTTGGEEITTLQIDGLSGEQGSESALALGRQVRAAGLATHAPAGAQLSGGGVDVFLAGSPRSVEDGAVFSLRGRNMARAPGYGAYLRQMTGDGRVSRFLDEEAPRLRARDLALFEMQMLGLATGDVAQPFGLIGQEVKE